MPAHETPLAPEEKPLAPAEESSPQRMEIHIPWVTFVRIFAVILVASSIYVLWPLLLLVFLALFLAVTLQTIVEWLMAKGLKRRSGILVIVVTLITAIAASMALIVPSLSDQVTAFSSNFPKLRDNALNQLPVGGSIRESMEHMMQVANLSEVSTWMGQFLSAGGIALGGVSEILLLLVIALYLLMDGSKTYEWLLAFFSPLKRAKLRLTSDEISKVMFGYVSGQFVTSTLVMLYVFTVLSLLHVPAALMLAILAGVFDILPVLGFLISTGLAFLLALSVSHETALIVLGLYMLFHALEVYFIIPRIYGNTLRLSTLTVLLGLLAGGLLAGIPGAIAALPVIASYAAVERIWLKPFLREGVAEKHELQKEQQFGEKD